MASKRIHRAGLSGGAVCGERGINVSVSTSGCCVTCEKCLAAEKPWNPSPEELAAYYTRELEKTRAREAKTVPTHHACGPFQHGRCVRCERVQGID